MTLNLRQKFNNMKNSLKLLILGIAVMIAGAVMLIFTDNINYTSIVGIGMIINILAIKSIDND